MKLWTASGQFTAGSGSNMQQQQMGPDRTQVNRCFRLISYITPEVINAADQLGGVLGQASSTAALVSTLPLVTLGVLLAL